jgi:anti-anti-sigma regulatory factor
MQDVSPDTRLVLDGALTIRNAAAIRATLLDTVTSHSAITIDCTAAVEVDLSFIQLLIATGASASAAGKSVTLATRPDGAFLDALARGGFRVNSENPAGDPPFWFEGAAS